ncbi:MAG: methyltransferase [Pseudomonadota bacterium]
MSDQHEIDFQRLILIAGGHSAFQLLWAGIELGIFDLLSREPQLTLAQVADQTKLQPYPARVLLIGLTALGLIKKHDAQYSNASLTEQMLVKGKPGYAAPILGWQAHIVYPGLIDFVESLRQSRNVGLERFPGPGNTLYERLTAHPKVEEIFQTAMSSLSSQANTHLLSAYDFGNLSHIVDAGGGDGTNAMALARKFPKLRVTIFDSPTVCEIARKNIAANGLEERVSVWPGNFLSDPFPPGIDAVIYCHIFTIWSLEHELALLKRTYSALPSGGSVFLFNMMGNDDDSGPLSTALGSPYFLGIATGEGMLHSWNDYETIALKAGFANVRRIDNLPLNHGLIVGTK